MLKLRNIFILLIIFFIIQDSLTSLQPITTLSALIGDFTGAVKLIWIYPNTLPVGSSYYIQHSTNPSENWNPMSSQIIKSTQVSAGTQQIETVGGLDMGRDGTNNIISPCYYFRVWLSTVPGVFSSISNGATSYPNIPTVADVFIDYGINNGWLVRSHISPLDIGWDIYVDNSCNIFITGSYWNGFGYDIIVRK